MNPTDYGWKGKGEFLLPKNCTLEIPKSLTTTGGCNGCKSKACGCKRNLTKCTIYCECEGNATCHNL